MIALNALGLVQICFDLIMDDSRYRLDCMPGCLWEAVPTEDKIPGQMHHLGKTIH